MTQRIWKTKVPGQDTFDVTDELADGPDVQVTLTAPVPDVVRLPAEIGGEVVRVLSSKMAACPCGREHQVRHLELERSLGVAECQNRGFLWYRRR